MKNLYKYCLFFFQFKIKTNFKKKKKMSNIKQTTIDINKNITDEQNQKKQKYSNVDKKQDHGKKRKYNYLSDSEDDDDNFDETNKNEMNFLIDASPYDIQTEVFDLALEKTFKNDVSKQLGFLSHYLKFQLNQRDEYERIESMYPAKRSDNNKRYYYGGKKVIKKIEGSKTGIDITVQRIRKRKKILEESDNEE
jgi:hypothetical protein